MLETRVKLPIRLGSRNATIEKVGDMTLVTRYYLDTDHKVSMIINADYNQMAAWHHKEPQPYPTEEFPDLGEAEVNFLRFGSIYDTNHNNHNTFDNYGVNFYR